MKIKADFYIHISVPCEKVTVDVGRICVYVWETVFSTIADF